MLHANVDVWHAMVAEAPLAVRRREVACMYSRDSVFRTNLSGLVASNHRCQNTIVWAFYLLKVMLSH